MDTGISKQECEKILRKANKILNLWIEQELPFTYENLLKKKHEDHLSKLRAEALFMQKYEEPLLQLGSGQQPSMVAVEFENKQEQVFYESITKQLGTLTIEDHSHQKKGGQTSIDLADYMQKCFATIHNNPNLTIDQKTDKIKALIEGTEEYRQGLKKSKSSAERVNKIITSEYSFALFEMFKLYLYEGEKDDLDIELNRDDLKLEQKLALKEIQRIIKTLPINELNALYALDDLFIKIISILNYSQFESAQNIDFDTLESWGKIGLWLIDRSAQVLSQQWERRAMKPFVQHIQKTTTPYVSLIYANIAYFLSMSEMPEKIFSQNLLEITQSLKEKITITPQSMKTTQFIDSISFCAQAKNALNNKDIEGFLFCLDKAIAIEYRYTSSVFNMLYLAGKHFSETDPGKTQQYFKKALDLIDSANEKESSLEKVRLLEIEKFVSEYKAKKLSELQAEIIKEFPNKCGVGVSGQRLNVFLHLEQLPRQKIGLPSNCTIITDLKEYDKVVIKDKVVTGFRFYTASDNNQAVMDAIRKLIQKIKNALDLECARFNLQPQQSPVLALEPVASKATPALQSGQPIRTGPKKKTRGVAGNQKNNTQPLRLVKSPLVIKKTAEQYGFNLEGYSRIAPLFFSNENQATGMPKLIVAWDDKKCTTLDHETINKFKSLFNPNGVVQARQVNDSGFKVCMGPKKEWIVRGKLKGAGGSTRVYFKPKQTIVTENGDEITLCVLSKKMSK